MDSQSIRKEFREKRRRLLTEQQDEHGQAVRSHLVNAQLAVQTKVVAGYLVDDGELDLQATFEYLWSQAVEVSVPKIRERSMYFVRYRKDDSMTTNRFGIVEPQSDQIVEIHKHCVVLFPGVAFSYSGQRIGRGGGYYDRYFADHKAMVKIGVAHSFQLADELPSHNHDIKLDAVVSEQGWAYANQTAEKYLNIEATDGS